MKKKLLVAIMTLVMAIGTISLAGCGGSEDSGDAEEQAAAETPSNNPLVQVADEAFAKKRRDGKDN